MHTPLSPFLALCLLCSGTLVSAEAKEEAARRPETVLIETDEAFCKAAATIGIIEAFKEYAAKDAIFFDVDPRDARGAAVLEQRRSRWAGLRRLHWKPLGAEIAASGDLGYTWGESLSETEGKDGKLTQHKGLYVSIWRKGADGRWRYVLDTGNDAPKRKTEN